MMRLKRAPVLALLLLQACSGMPQPQPDDGTVRAGPPRIIYVARRSWHIDVGFSTADLEPPLASVAADFPSSRYLFFGFGDRHYLVAKHKNFPGLLAALWPSAAVVLTTGFGALPEEAFGTGRVIRLSVTPAQMRAAQRFMRGSILEDNGAPVIYAMGGSEGSLFFGSVPKYSAVHTCNTWAAEVLQAAGLPVHSVGVVFAAQLWSQVRRIDEAAAPISARDAPFAALASLPMPDGGHAHE
jgi:hypothetical protein